MEKKDKIKIYLASPYTSGNKDANTQLQIDIAYQLLIMGFNPYVPLFNHYIQVDHPNIDTDLKFDWLEIDKAWLKECDIVFRFHPKDNFDIFIPSPGADEEEKYAQELEIPVFNFKSISEMVEFVESADFTFIK